MSNSQRETVDHWSFVEGVKSPLGRLADACMNAYEENGDTLLVEAADALRAIETVDLTGVNKCNPCKSLPWHMSHEAFDDGRASVIASNGRVVQLFQDLPVCKSVVECINTVYSLKNKERRIDSMSDNFPIINDGPDADDISEVVIECVRKNCYGDTSAFKVAEITRETNLWNDLSFDGLDMVELIMDVEDKLSQLPPYHSVSIPEDVCDEIETVGDFVDAVFRIMGVRE